MTRWRVTITTLHETHVREVVGVNEGQAAFVALGGLVTPSAGLRKYGPQLGYVQVQVSPLPKTGG